MIKGTTATAAAGRRQLDRIDQQKRLVLSIAYSFTLLFVLTIAVSYFFSVDILTLILAYLPCFLCLLAIKAGLLQLAKLALFISALSLASVFPVLLSEPGTLSILFAACVPLPFLLFSREESRIRTVCLFSVVLAMVVTYLASGLYQLISLSSFNLWSFFLSYYSLFIDVGGIVVLSVFVSVMAKKYEYTSDNLYRSEQKLEAVITSLNDVVFEVNDSYRILNVWAGDDTKLPLPRHLYENLTADEVLTKELYSKFQRYVDDAFHSGVAQKFEYLSPTNNKYYEVCVKKLSSLPNEEERIALSLRDISDQQEVRKHLAIQNRFVESHWDSVVYTDMKGVVSFANEITYRQNQLKPKSLNGKNISLLLSEKKYLVDLILSELNQQQSWCGETTLTRPTGEIARIAMSVMLLRNDAKEAAGLAWSMRDITEMKQAERLLRLSEKRFKSMAVNAPGIIYEWYSLRDGSGWGFNYISPRVEEILGLDAKKCQADASEMMQYLHPEDMEGFVESVNEVTKNLSVWNHISRLVLPGNDVRWMQGISTPIDCDEEKVVFHGILMDITQQERSKDELLKAKEKAEVAIKEKSNFLSTMSHEIRTPLNAVIGLSHLLLEETPDTKQIENLKTLKFSAENLLGLINDILDFSKIEAGKIQLEKIPVDIGTLVRGIVSSLEFQANDNGVDLRLVIDPGLPVNVLADPIRLSQVLNNLVSNALKFTEEGYVEIRLAVKQVLPHSVSIEFMVKDTGIGIEMEKQHAIFEFFNQADNSVTRQYGGTGLGLAITRGILHMYGSEIKLRSAPHKGASFSFCIDFPVALDESKPVIIASDSAVESLKGRRILLVEDNRVNVMVATKLLTNWGAAIDVANDGEVAIQKVKDNDYDVVLMDIQMPVMDGYEATKAIREMEGKYLQLPIIALTATVMEEVQRRTKEVGLNGILSKPIKPRELKNQLVRYIQ